MTRSRKRIWIVEASAISGFLLHMELYVINSFRSSIFPKEHLALDIQRLLLTRLCLFLRFPASQLFFLMSHSITSEKISRHFFQEVRVEHTELYISAYIHKRVNHPKILLGLALYALNQPRGRSVRTKSHKSLPGETNSNRSDFCVSQISCRYRDVDVEFPGTRGGMSRAEVLQ